MRIGIRFYKGTKTILDEVSPGSPTVTWSPKLVFSPGFYTYGVPTYDIREPGLYAFSHYFTQAEQWNNTTHMIVPDGDPVTLLSAAAWLTAFGDQHASLSYADMSVKARTSSLSLMCEHTHTWARNELLTPQGVTSRLVHFLTMDTANDAVDGHVALEVMVGGNWVLADLSNNCIITDASGNRLSADDAVTAIAAEAFDHEILADDAPYAVEANGGFDATAYGKAMLSTPQERKDWQGRIFQAIGMWHNGELLWKLPEGSEDRTAWVESKSPYWKVKDETYWNTTFY